MEISGKIIEVLPERSGTSTNGPWKIASYLLEVPGFTPKKVMFEVSDGMGGRIAAMNIKKGEFLTVYIDIDAHEYNGRWFNSIKAYSVRRDNQGEPEI